MSKSVELVESRARILELDSPQLDELTRLASDLAGKTYWWGYEQDAENSDPRVLNIEALGHGRYAVTVFNAIGAIGLPGLTLNVRPKIPMPHFVYIAREGLRSIERSDKSPAFLRGGADFIELVCLWLIDSTKALVQQGLENDYREASDRLASVRGSLDVRATARNWLTGSALVQCTFDDFTTDSAMNRVIKAAVQVVSVNTTVSESTRAEARSLVRRFWEIGDLTRQDLLMSPRRGQLRYVEPLSLAQQVLDGIGRSLDGGALRSDSFLFPTPRLIEEGIRSILRRALNPIPVLRRGRLLPPSTVSVNPDLEIGPPPFTGDVKYKLSSVAWNRSDLAQAIFFATAYRSPLALIVNFRKDGVSGAGLLQVGDVRVGSASWDAGEQSQPSESEIRMVAEVRQALNLPQPVGFRGV